MLVIISEEELIELRNLELENLYDFSKDARLNHRIEVVSGVLQEECAKFLKDFFKALRVA